jgi:hypothetical protein
MRELGIGNSERFRRDIPKPLGSGQRLEKQEVAIEPYQDLMKKGAYEMCIQRPLCQMGNAKLPTVLVGKGTQQQQ